MLILFYFLFYLFIYLFFVEQNFVRLIVVFSTGLVVVIIPDFGILISLIGATCCTLLAFILPAIFYLRIFKRLITHLATYFLGVSSLKGLFQTLQLVDS